MSMPVTPPTEPTPTPTPAPQPAPVATPVATALPSAEQGKILSLISAVKGLTLTNVLVIVLLALVAIPAYLVYRATNDEALMDRFLSYYKTTSSPMTNCTITKARQRGEPYVWIIRNGFAFEGGTRWYMNVTLDFEPNSQQLNEYCDALTQLIDYMRDPGGADTPKSPKDDRPIIDKYRGGQ